MKKLAIKEKELIDAGIDAFKEHLHKTYGFDIRFAMKFIYTEGIVKASFYDTEKLLSVFMTINIERKEVFYMVYKTNISTTPKGCELHRISRKQSITHYLKFDY